MTRFRAWAPYRTKPCIEAQHQQLRRLAGTPPSPARARHDYRVKGFDDRQLRDVDGLDEARLLEASLGTIKFRLTLARLGFRHAWQS
ncbi:hypothetical protein [Nonomuraea sp. NPDC049158]|uniref:hypothetical protein n=1 Tax=Nonomuraea sp. NPDC049158 TaxID=3155649 RepID=UPI0033D1131C